MVSPQAIAEGDGDPFLGAVLAGRFAILGMIGAGSMGTVYHARHEAIGRDLALKVVRADRLLDAQAKARFQQEAHAMSLLASPYTVTVYDFGEARAAFGDPEGIDGSLYLAMELLDGESVGDRIKRLGRLELTEASMIVRHALSSLAEAHDKGVVHRDLKPDNLLVTRAPTGEPVCKVLDFGIAKLLHSDGRVDVLETQAGTVFGTPRYMSPEQAQGRKLDARSDLYALGVILYHMLAGRAPFTDDDAVVVMAHHIKTIPKRPTEVAPGLRIPGALEDLLMRVLDKDPARRPQSAAEFLALLEQALGAKADASVEMPVVSSAAPKRPPSFVWGALVAVGIGVVLATMAFLFQNRGPRTSEVPGPALATAEATASRGEAAAASVGTAVEPPIEEASATLPASAMTAEVASPSSPYPYPSASGLRVLTVPPKKRTYTKFDH
ncbi:MAG: serine/threonine protein kinase [Deltaproteobacteria bacterium]|nr:serine/threonine protein kinase [Deltaproteobacteria bacterium]